MDQLKQAILDLITARKGLKFSNLVKELEKTFEVSKGDVRKAISALAAETKLKLIEYRIGTDGELTMFILPLEADVLYAEEVATEVVVPQDLVTGYAVFSNAGATRTNDPVEAMGRFLTERGQGHPAQLFGLLPITIQTSLVYAQEPEEKPSADQEVQATTQAASA